MQSYIIIHILATLFIKKCITLHKLSFFLLFNTRFPIFAEENQRTQNYGTRNLLGKKRRPDRRAEDRQTLGRRSQQRRQALPRPASEAEREGFEPPVPLSTPVFKTGVIDHSTISPSDAFQKCGAKVVTFFEVCKLFPHFLH